MVKCNGFNLKSALAFSNLHSKCETGNLTLYEFTKIVKTTWCVKNIKQIIFEMINNNLLCNDDFVDCNNIKKLVDDNKFNKQMLKKLVLDYSGLTAIMFYPTEEHFNDYNNLINYKRNVTKSFGLFLKNYFKMVQDLLDNGSDELQMIYKQYKTDVLGTASINFSNNDLGFKVFKEIHKSVSKLEHHKGMPMLIKEKGSYVTLIDIEKCYGKSSDTYAEVEQLCENKKGFKDYRFLTKPEYNKICDAYFEMAEKNGNDSDSDSDNDSDCEEL